MKASHVIISLAIAVGVNIVAMIIYNKYIKK